MTEIGLGVSRPGWRMRIGIWDEHFDWTPGEYESGTSTPPQMFDYGCTDEYWYWTFLWFVLFYARVR